MHLRHASLLPTLFDEQRIREALAVLGQDPDMNLVRVFLNTLSILEPLRTERESGIEAYLNQHCSMDAIPEHLTEYQELQGLRRQVLDLFKEADQLAGIVRIKSGRV